MGRSLNGFCPEGHHISGKNVIMRRGGYKGQKFKNCRKCYNARRRKRLKERRANDPAYRAKLNKQKQAYRARLKAQQ